MASTPPKYKEIRPIKISTGEFDALEVRLKKFFREYIYLPLLKEINTSSKVLKNAKVDPLVDALFTGRITFNRGTFSGKLNSGISEALRALGAKFDRKEGTYKIPAAKLPMEIRGAISASASKFQQKVDKITEKLASIAPEALASKFKSADLFDRTLWKVDKQFRQNVKNITVAVDLTDEHRKRIADEWQNNMQLYIKDFTQKEIVELRKTVQDSVFAGNRYESLVGGIQKSYGVSARKAKFLARQETNLLLSTHNQAKYQSAGIDTYKWGCVKRPHDKSPNQHTPGNVRYWHGKLDQTLQKFSKPPVTGPNGEKNNPGADYNCIPGSNIVRLDCLIEKAYRRWYSGELTLLIFDNGIIHESTGNHPILTQRGWIGAKDIQVGDYVFESIGKGIDPKKVNRKNMEASIEQIFEALSMCLEIFSDTIRDVDFHHDVGSDKQVDIITMDRKLILHSVTALFQFLSQFDFQSADSFTSDNSSLLQTMGRWRLTADSIMGFCSELDQFILGHTPESNSISFGAGPSLNSGLNQPLFNGTPGDPVFFGNSKFTHPILIILDCLLNRRHKIEGFESCLSFDLNTSRAKYLAEDIRMDFDPSTDFGQSKFCGLIKPLRVVDKQFRSFSGHVYNLQTNNNWYISQDVIIHNCRCFAIPIVKF